MSHQIAIANSQNYLEIDRGFLEEVAKRTLNEEKLAATEVSIALVDNAAIQEINKRFLEHDYATDVLSFVLESQQSVASEPDEFAHQFPGLGKRIEGEVVISAEMAVSQAADFDWSPHDEVVLYLVHGLLHLAGYNDLSEAEQTVMRARERAILGIWNLTPNYNDGQLRNPSKPIEGLSGSGS